MDKGTAHCRHFAVAEFDSYRQPASNFRVMTKPMTPDDISDALVQVPEWKVVRDALERTFEFRDFSEALGFVVRVGVEAERINHHPEISNVWNRVTLRLTTHEAGDKISERDLTLAKAVQSLI